MRLFKWLRNRSEAGQSLAEVTIMLPLIIVLLAGVIEVSNLLIAQNRVTTAAGAATSFAVTNFREDTLPNGWDTAMAEVAVNSARNTPQEAADMWDFAVIRAKTAQNEADGSVYFASWEMSTPNDSDGMPSAEELQQKVLEDVGPDGYDLDLIITVAHGQYDSIVGLESFFSSYPDKLTAVSVGVVDRVQEPAAICLQWTETETGENGPVPALSAIDIKGVRIAEGAFQGVRYATLRTWEGGQGTANYSAENKPTGAPPSIKFDAVGEDQLGEDTNGQETDTFIIVLEEKATHVTVFHKAPDEVDGIMPLEVGQYVSNQGYQTRLVSMGMDEGDPTYTFETTTVGPQHALSHIEFAFKKTKTVEAVCEEWGTPEDTGNYTDIISP